MKGLRVSALMLLVALAGVVPASAESPEELFERGNAAYEKGKWADAVHAYTTVVQYGIRDARVEYNLGNAYYKLGDLGRAILHYERAYRLAPTDSDVLANLELARSRRFDRIEQDPPSGPVRWMRTVQDRLGPDRQALGLLILVWLVAGLVTWASARHGGWNAFTGWALAVLLVAMLALGASWAVTRQRLEGPRLAVVLDDAVQVLAGPGENNASLFTVHAGLALRVRSERPDWVQVSLPNGLNGWVPRATLGFV